MPDILEEPCIYIDKNGNEHEIYPMLLKDCAKVSRLVSKLESTEYLYLNIPAPKVNKSGKVVIDKKTKEPIFNDVAFNAMMTIFELALREPRDVIDEWIDLKNGVEILDGYLQISGLKKKIAQQAMVETLQSFSQQ